MADTSRVPALGYGGVPVDLFGVAPLRPELQGIAKADPRQALLEDARRRQLEKMFRYTTPESLSGVVSIVEGGTYFSSGSVQAAGRQEKIIWVLKPENPAPLTEAFFHGLASSAPQRLLDMIRYGGLRNSQLTFAAEAVGSISDAAQALTVLRGLTDHPSALVREGAVLGLATLGTDEAVALLRRIAESDPSQTIRRVAADSVSDT